ncbi:MAG TPA: UDP-glucose/GDP-mannose dehydrogenase family protein [Acidimicrobiia bacterium]|nr:UDP-glucose/GDP-mannose dehydrogenase family protein [Acidimicrobiia bacterium]
MTKVAVIGAGYVGSTSAACFAHLGHEVVCADLDERRVEALNRGESPILEAQLPELIREGVDAGRLRFVVGAANAVRDAEVVLLCVDTPQSESGEADLSHVEAAVREFAPELKRGAIVVNKSTMPVGSTAKVKEWLQEAGVADGGVRVAVNPEFLQEGTAVREFLNPARIVLGVEDEETAVRLSLLYQKLQARIIVTDPPSAEMIKYASNAYLATRISFINSIANLCEAVGADVTDVTLGMGYDPRIGFSGLRPGPGYGGSCLPKDTAALLATARRAGYDFEHLQATVAVNRAQPDRVVEKVRKAVGGDLAGRLVGVLGLTFKAGTDDVRESPAMEIARRLAAEGAVIRAYDPAANRSAVAAMAPEVTLLDDPYEALTGADVLAVLTEWDEFRWLDYARVRELMSGCAVVDARNALDRETLGIRGFEYQGVGCH